MSWGLVVIGVIAFAVLMLCTHKGSPCPGGCHGCGRCLQEKIQEKKNR